MGSTLFEMLDGLPNWLMFTIFAAMFAAVMAFALTMADYSKERNATYQAQRDAAQAEWFADCEVHEPRYLCEHRWRLTH